MKIADINNREDLTLCTGATDNDMTSNEWLFNLGCDCDSFFTKAEHGEFTEIYGFEGIVPTLSKTLHVHLIKGSATLVAK